LHEFSGPLGLKWGFWEQNRGPNELVCTFAGYYVCANFSKNRSRNATVRVRTDRRTDANRFYNLCHVICFSCGTDNNIV